MHVDEFIFNCCVSSMISDDIPDTSGESAMNVFSIDENKIRDANGIIFAEAITCYKCTFCGKMFAAMEVVLTHYQSNHRSSVIPLLKGMSKICSPKTKSLPKISPKNKSKKSEPYGPIKPRPNVLAESTATNEVPRLLRDSTKNIKKENSCAKKEKNQKFKCHYWGCSKSFSYRIGLETHQKIHKRVKSYKCDWNGCKFKCSDLAGLRFHKNTHSGDNPFKCVWPGCMQSFPSSAAKDEHLQTTHIKDRLLECDYVGCDAKFITSKERDWHKYSHISRRIRHNSNSDSTPGLKVRKVGRPSKRKPIAESSSDSDSSDGEDNENLEEDNEEEEEEEEDRQLRSINQTKSEDMKEEQHLPLDLSKTAIVLSANNTAIDLTFNSSKEKKIKDNTPAKRGRKRKKSKDNTIQKTVFRCDYPGCRKTFPEADVLHEHEKEAHKTETTEGRSRYERRCKGNLYYKL